jgi:hypothetical protein
MIGLCSTLGQITLRKSPNNMFVNPGKSLDPESGKSGAEEGWHDENRRT